MAAAARWRQTRRRRRRSLISAEWRPDFQAFRLPFGAPGRPFTRSSGMPILAKRLFPCGFPLLIDIRFSPFFGVPPSPRPASQSLFPAIAALPNFSSRPDGGGWHGYLNEWGTIQGGSDASIRRNSPHAACSASQPLQANKISCGRSLPLVMAGLDPATHLASGREPSSLLRPQTRALMGGRLGGRP